MVGAGAAGDERVERNLHTRSGRASIHSPEGTLKDHIVAYVDSLMLNTTSPRVVKASDAGRR